MVNLKAYTLDQLNNYHFATVGVRHYLPTSKPIGGADTTIISNARKMFETSFPPSNYVYGNCSVTIPIGVKFVPKWHRDHFVEASYSCFNLKNSEVQCPDMDELKAYQENPETNILVLQEDFPLLVFWNLGAFYNKIGANKLAFDFVLENSSRNSKRTFTLDYLYQAGLFHSTYSYSEYLADLEEEAKPTFFLKHFGSCKVPKDNNYLFGALNEDYTFSYMFCQDNPKYVS